jgi:hypothetical protein
MFGTRWAWASAVPTPADSGFERGTYRSECILDPQHALLELDAGSTAHSDDGDSARQTGDSDVEHVLVGVELGPFALGLELTDPGVEGVLLTVGYNEGGVVIGGGEHVTRTEVIAGDLAEFNARCPSR